MDFRYVGRSGLLVSTIGLGTLTWGRDVDVQDAGELLRTLVSHGGTVVDTSASYGAGRAEAVLGECLGHRIPRSDVVLVGKAGMRPGKSRYAADTSRGTLLHQLDQSLGRLATDYLDLWLVQTWDEHVPLEETLSAMELAVTSGRVRYVGFGGLSGWQLATAATQANYLNTHAKVIAHGAEHSLLERTPEHDALDAAEHLNIGTLAWSALGRGVLTGKYSQGTPATSRAATPYLASYVEPFLTDECQRIVQSVETAAQGLSTSCTKVAIGWLLSKPTIACAIIGARTAEQLTEVLAEPIPHIPAQIIQALDDVSVDR